MKRRIKKSDVDWTTIHGSEDSLEIILLEFTDINKSLKTLFVSLSKNHLTNSLNLLSLEELMLRTSKTNSFSTIIDSSLAILFSISVSSDHKGTSLISNLE